MRILVSITILFSILATYTQSYAHTATLTYKKYWVALKDKANNPYNINQAEEFLSAKAIERRKRYNIPIIENDLPVSPKYTEEIQAKGAKILFTSKWLNAIAVEVEDTATLIAINELAFVKKIERAAKYKSRRKPLSERKEIFRVSKKIEDLGEAYYGAAFNQLQMLNGDYLHALGYNGEGMTIAVMDAGFQNVDVLEAFKHLHEEKRLLGTVDFVDGDDNVFDKGTHGTQVLSIIAANLPSVFVGSAPAANYYLFRTEDGRSETITEEYNWIAAAEFSDSAGVDVINTSLGYSRFDDPNTSYTYKDLDGNTSRITKGADIAASKGMLVVCSAGNQGNKDWTYVTAPADGDSVLTVGAVDRSGNYALFSSRGPAADGRIKPNISALGSPTALVSVDGVIRSGNGTSYASPIVAGLSACLWQANKFKNNMEIVAEIEKSANQYDDPDDKIGHGLPDFKTAFETITDRNPIFTFDKEAVAFVYPNPFATTANIYYYSQTAENIRVELYDASGRLLTTFQKDVIAQHPYKLSVDWNKYTKGVYLVHIKSSSQQKILKAIKMSN